MRLADQGDGLRAWSRQEVIAEGARLGLEPGWLARLPHVEELAGDYAAAAMEGDAFLVWKAQELLARTGRLAEADAMLVAEALEDAAANDGPRWPHDGLRRLMFLMAWPRRTYHQHVELGLALDHLRGCLEESPSMWLLVDEKWDRSWYLARSDVLGLDDGLDLPEACPWPALADLERGAEERLAEGRRRFR